MSVDWSTLALQTVNVAVLIWLLSRVFWRPLAHGIAARRAEAQSILHDAETARAEAEALRAKLAAEHESIAGERQDALKAAAEAAEAERARLLAAARAEAEKLESAARARIEAQRDTTEAAFADRAADLAAEMAARLGRQMDGPALRAACLDALGERIGRLDEKDRKALVSDGGFTVATPTALDPEEEARIRARLAEATGGAPTLSFRTDPALVAGMEIAGPHLTVSNSWREGLARMREEIARDG